MKQSQGLRSSHTRPNIALGPGGGPAVNAATGRCCQHSRRWTTATVLQVVSGGVDCGIRQRNVYDKKPQRYTKDNRTAHLTARSDKAVAYVTNNKRLYSTFCTVEAIY